MLRPWGCNGRACRGLLGRPCDRGSRLHITVPTFPAVLGIPGPRLLCLASLDPTQDVHKIHRGSVEETRGLRVDESALVILRGACPEELGCLLTPSVSERSVGKGVLSDQKSAIWSHLLPIKGGRTQFSFNTFQKWDVVFQDMA